jgi:rod shape-determining protein MreC
MRLTFDPFNQPAAPPINRRRISAILGLVVLALVLIVLDGQGILDPVKSRAQRVLQPVAQTLTQARIELGTAVGSITGRGAMQQELERLQQEVSALRDENIRLKVYADKIGLLEQQLQIDRTYNWRTLDATVVRGSTEEGQRIVRINRGRVDNVSVGMAVVSKEGGSPAALIGVIDRVYAQAADVLLITDYGLTISAKTAGTERVTSGLISGRWQLGSRLELTDVTREIPLVAGQYVVTAGLSRGLATDTPVAEIPPDVPIGQIISVDTTGHSQTANVQPFVDPDRVRNVWVITELRDPETAPADTTPAGPAPATTPPAAP